MLNFSEKKKIHNREKFLVNFFFSFTVKLAKFASAYSKVGFGMFVISHLNVSQGPSSQETDGALTSENIGKFVYKGANYQV